MTDIVERLRGIADAMHPVGSDTLREAADLLARLPVTADGVRVVPKQDGVFIWMRGRVWVCYSFVHDDDQWFACTWEPLDPDYPKLSMATELVTNCYSTPEAAKEAT